jgi:hypothetical protein
MSRLFIWLGQIVGMLLYCAFVPGYMTVNEFAAAAYFSGAALLVHWANERLSGILAAKDAA